MVSEVLENSGVFANDGFAVYLRFLVDVAFLSINLLPSPLEATSWPLLADLALHAREVHQYKMG